MLRNHLFENAKRQAFGKTYQEKYLHLVKTIDIAASTASTKSLSTSEAKGILKVLQNYAYALEMLDRYDHQTLSIAGQRKQVNKQTYQEGIRLIAEWRILQKAGPLFGNKKDESFKSSLENIYQTFDGKDL